MRPTSLLLVLGLFLVGLAIAFVAGKDCIVASDDQDDTDAIVDAFEACKNGGRIIFEEGVTYHFNTPGTTLATLQDATVKIKGTIEFPENTDFQNVDYYMTVKGDNVVFHGTGDIDGNGQAYWNHPDDYDDRPYLIQFQLTNSEIYDLTFHDSPSHHIRLYKCSNLVITDIEISVTESRLEDDNTADNTDGINLGGSHDVQINDVTMNVFDDCVSFLGDTHDIVVDGLSCTNGHGASIGTLGDENDDKSVYNILVRNSEFYDCQYAARIKAYLVEDDNDGYVKNVTFSNILVDGATRVPICINQNKNQDDDGEPFKFLGAKFQHFTIQHMDADQDVITVWCYTDDSSNKCGKWEFSDINFPSNTDRVQCHEVRSSWLSGVECNEFDAPHPCD
eukprot:TRINITY_DN4011_c0_g1_i1.p1 TRINITY_DN4011_c0_g1~~TRINITY_DN4011_c0_g1_i1.p1  ORF type:complete len:392 (+),score=78.50 TRINITY_DN4011_c0_g1_i1:120-1295(+)